jgi:class 3 adenylate cyclase
MRLGIGLGMGPDAAKAARAAARQAKRSCPRPTLALAFGSNLLDQKRVHAALAAEVDPDILLGGSSYAEITPAGVTKGSVAVLLAELEGVKPRFAGVPLGATPRDTGTALVKAMGRPCGSEGLPLAFLFSSLGNGYENDALQALRAGLGRFPVFGGLCSGQYDLGMSHPDFFVSRQYSGAKLTTRAARMALMELPKDRYGLGFGFEHGWEAVGPESRVTRTVREKVLEVDGIPVMDYYRQFLGDHSPDFFELLVQRFGFALQLEGAYEGTSLIKLPVRVDCRRGTISYFPAEDLKDRRVRLIVSSRRGVLAGARRAAERCKQALGRRKPAVVLVVSCCSRGAILHSQLDLEIDIVRQVFGAGVPVFGFYSGGEILPFLSKYADIVDPACPFSGSFYHTTTMGLLALSAQELPKKVSAPRRGSCSPRTAKEEAARLRSLLTKSETVLDDTEAFLGNLSRKSYEDGQKVLKQAEVLHRYTPEDVWRKIGRNAERGRFELADAEFKGAFLFMDVKGFTSFSETHPPGEVVSALNEIFDPATELICGNGGTVDKFIGDCIFAAFPRPAAAVKTAKELLKLVAKTGAAGSPFTVRIGVNAGRAVRANVGGKRRREYTYIGDAVNTAQRLESACPPGKAMLGGSLEAEGRRVFGSLERREITAKGKSAPVACWEGGL